MRIVVYTAIYGGYDEVHRPHRAFENTDFVLFTDTPQESDIWDVRVVPRPENPRMAARYFKHNPHELFPDYDISLWIDGCYELMGDPWELVPYLDSADLAVCRHPERDCIYEEAEKCLEWGYDDPDKIRKQMQRYREDGLPEHQGLIESGMMIRRHHAMSHISRAWWAEIWNNSYRDQLSFNYVAWRHGFHWQPTRMYPKLTPHIRFHDNGVFLIPRGHLGSRVWSP